MEPNRKISEEILYSAFGYREFKDTQWETIQSVLMGRDTLVSLSTGGGKSICFQFPALVSEGIVLVISPLLALIKDQIYNLAKHNIPAVSIHSGTDPSGFNEILNQIKNNELRIVYISPERLTNATFIAAFQGIKTSLIAVDEAHCVSVWGQDFRPAYKQIKKFRKSLPSVPILALSATASKKVKADIIQELELKDCNTIEGSLARSNIALHLIKLNDKYNFLYHYIKQHTGTGIVYVNSRKEAEGLCSFLYQKGLRNVDFFHAGLASYLKELKQNTWITQSQRWMVATSAFGMGIDHPSVRHVIHLAPSYSLENYFQEVGRAGRDGAYSDAVMLWNDQMLESMGAILKNQLLTNEECVKITEYLYTKIGAADGEFPIHSVEIVFEECKKFGNVTTSKLNSLLQFLENEGLFSIKRTSKHSKLELLYPIEELLELHNKDSAFIEKLSRNILGLNSGEVRFNLARLAARLKTNEHNLTDVFRTLERKGFVRFTDGYNMQIRCTMERNVFFVRNKMYPHLLQIQNNKLQKWEEMKFFIKEQNFCKMKLILAYFGQKPKENCGHCSYCIQHKSLKEKEKLIIENLNSPSDFESLYAKCLGLSSNEVLEIVMDLLEKGKIKMQDFKTYTIA